MFVEKAFGLNDWVVIFSIVIVWTVFFLLPKMLPRQITLLILLYGLTIPSICDNTLLGSGFFNFYNIMDGPAYTVMDVFVYFIYMPYAYFFIFIYQFLKIKGLWIVPYISLWTILSMLMETFFVSTHVFTYENGFSGFDSFCIYLITQTGLLIFFNVIDQKKPHRLSKHP